MTEALKQEIRSTIRHWVDTYSEDLYSWAFYKTSDDDIAKDLVQETFIAAFVGFEKYGEKSNPKAWLFGILKNKIIDHYRRSFRQLWVTESKLAGNDSFFENYFSGEGKFPDHWNGDAIPAPDFLAENNSLENEELQQVLADCIKKLPELWNHAISLKYLEETDSKIICQELEISATNYWQILRRAKLQLRKCLETNWFSED